MNAKRSAFTPHAAFLDAAKRRFRRCQQHLVDADHADFHVFRGPRRCPQVVGEQYPARPNGNELARVMTSS